MDSPALAQILSSVLMFYSLAPILHEKSVPEKKLARAYSHPNRKVKRLLGQHLDL